MSEEPSISPSSAEARAQLAVRALTTANPRRVCANLGVVTFFEHAQKDAWLSKQHEIFIIGNIYFFIKFDLVSVTPYWS